MDEAVPASWYEQSRPDLLIIEEDWNRRTTLATTSDINEGNIAVDWRVVMHDLDSDAYPRNRCKLGGTLLSNSWCRLLGKEGWKSETCVEIQLWREVSGS